MAVLGVIGGFALLAASIVWRGYVLSVIWLWFVASQFGAPALSIAQAIGLALVLSLLMPRYRQGNDTTFGMIAADAILTPLLTLGLAAIVRGFL